MKRACLSLILFPLVALHQSPHRVERLEESISRLMEVATVPGLAVALLEDGRLSWTGTFGRVRADRDDSVRINTIFEAASLSKPVFAAAVMQLVARGEFDLDEPLWGMLAYERLQAVEAARRITGRMVLTHSTGLPNWGGDELTLAFEPGSSWSYSGEGYVFLQRVIEKKTGLELDAFVRREVFEPVGMTQSSFLWQPAYDVVSAVGHDPLGEAQDKRRPDAGNAAASLHTTARDYGLFLAALVADGGPLAAGTLDLMLADVVPVGARASAEAGRHLEWGAGWGVQKGRTRAAFHWGDNGVFRCYVVLYPETGNGLVYLTNSQNGLAIAAALVGAAFDDRHWALEWLGYESYDDPARTTRIRLQRAFLAEAGAALPDLEAARRSEPGMVDQRFLINLAGFLRDRSRPADAVSVMKLATADFPESAAAHDQLGEAHLHAGQWQDAVDSSRRSLALDPENEGAQLRIQWALTALQALETAPSVDLQRLELLAGGYDSRQIRLRAGKLFYERAGVGLEYELYPLDTDLFGLVGLTTFRLRFVAGEDGAITRVVGIYYEGFRDESVRTGR